MNEAGEAKGWEHLGSRKARVTVAEASVEPMDVEAGNDSSPSDDSGPPVVEDVVVRLTPGEVVPGTRYRILRWLGEGGMGVVYECVHVDLERHVALKILRPGISPDSRKAKMFREEARAVSRAAAKEGRRAQNIVEVFDFGELPDARMWFSMELLDGRSLATCLGEGPMDQARLIGILRQVCKGLAAAHDADVVHRDVKPGNVMLVAEGRRKDFVKIVDFGVAAMLSGPSDDQIQLEGTPIYMAPEQASWGKFDRRLDIYAVGAMGYHLLVGRPPFVGSTVFKILRKVRKEQPPKPSDVAPPEVQIHPAFEAVLLKCLEKKPDDRYTDMRDLEAALCEAQLAAKLRTEWDDLPIPAVDGARREMLTRAFAARKTPTSWRPWAVAAMAVALVIAIASWIVLDRIGNRGGVPEPVAARIDAARGAAAKALFVYPPADDPDHPTAYTELLELERLEDDYGDAAEDAAASLRLEFAGTLVRLGDRYWDRDGGRPFALDYYVEALLFDPDNERARERAPLTPGAFLALQHKAAVLEFTPAELEASEPLAVLAQPDSEERVKRLRALRRTGKTDNHTRAAIDALLEAESVGPADEPDESSDAEVVARRSPDGEPAAAVEPLVAEPSTEQPPTVPTTPTAAATPEVPRDQAGAKKLVQQGLAALRGGDRAGAEKSFKQALSLDHKSHAAYDGLSRVAFDWGEYNTAVNFGKRAVSLSPRTSSYRVHLGDAYYKVFRFEDARREYDKAQELGDGSVDARLRKVREKLGG